MSEDREVVGQHILVEVPGIPNSKSIRAGAIRTRNIPRDVYM